MKKIFTIIFIALSFGIYSNKANAQVEKGTIILEPFYGFSLSSGTKALYEVDGANSTSYSQLGPMGLRFEYMLSDLIGLGLDVNYKKSVISSDYTSSYYDNNNYVTGNFTDTYTVPKTWIMARMNFHFVKTESIDFYAGYGIGYKMGSYSFKSTYPNSTPANIKVLIPIAFRMSTGFRYFFTDNIGASVELGFGGGSVATAGLTIKL